MALSKNMPMMLTLEMCKYSMMRMTVGSGALSSPVSPLFSDMEQAVLDSRPSLVTWS